MVVAAFPADVKVFIDGKDITKYIFGDDVITLSNINRRWTGIDISSFISGPGMHEIEITAGSGVGRVECRLEIS